ncbi:hypothetical protein NT03LS_3196a, partial [Listeria seeligeri FSL N1-067]
PFSPARIFVAYLRKISIANPPTTAVIRSTIIPKVCAFFWKKALIPEINIIAPSTSKPPSSTSHHLSVFCSTGADFTSKETTYSVGVKSNNFLAVMPFFCSAKIFSHIS